MTVKESIKTLMESLENVGLSRAAIGEELGYSEKSIAPLLSRGGNERFRRILQLLLQKAMLEKRIKTLESDNPAKEITTEMKKHLDALLKQADAMKKIIEANVSLETHQSHSENTDKNQRQRTFGKKPYPNKSTDVSLDEQQDSIHATGNKNKRKGSRGN